MFSVVSYLAIAIIAAGIAYAFSGRFLAVGALVLANVGVFVLSAFGPNIDANGISVIHVELGLDAQQLQAGKPVALLKLVTAMFVHADFFHIFFNLLLLVAFALPFEERIGHRRFTAIYLLSGLAGSLAQVAYKWGEPMLLMGASGALFGVIGAFGGAYPFERVRLPIPGPILFWARLPVIVFAMIAAALQTFYQLTLSPFSSVAFVAHLGGLASGLVLGFLFVRRHEIHGEPGPRTAVDFAKLEPFAQDPRARRALEELERSQDEPDVFRAWLEEFFVHARDPETGERVRAGPAGRIITASGKVRDVRL